MASECMDVESSPVFSEPTMEALFISKHNQSAEIYELFKGDVDALLKGSVTVQKQQYHITRILNHSEELYRVYEEEKNYLMRDVLCTWAIRQQKLTIATLYTQQMHYRQLDNIHFQFEHFGELLEQTINGLKYLKEKFSSVGFEEVR